MINVHSSSGNLLKALKVSDEDDEFLKRHINELSTGNLAKYIDLLLEEKQLAKPLVIKNSGLNQIYGFQIFNGKKKPTRDKLIALAIGMELTFDETQHLLNYAGFNTLYPKSKRDEIIIFALKKNLPVCEINTLLTGRMFPPL